MKGTKYTLAVIWCLMTQFSSTAQSCPTLCDPMNRSMPGFPVHHKLPESTQTNIYWVGDAIQPSHPLSSHSPAAINLSQIQVVSNESVFGWRGHSFVVSASASVLPMNIQDLFPLGWTDWISLNSKGLSRVFSNFWNSSKASILQRSAFCIVQPSHPYMTSGKNIALTRRTLWTK